MSELPPHPTGVGRPDLLAGEDFPPAPRQERSRRKREALLHSGLELFAERGYDATTIEDVAERAGVAVGSFYHHFRSKRQLLVMLMDCLLSEVTQMDMELITAVGVEPRAIINWTVRNSLSLHLQYAGVQRAWSEATAADPELATLHSAIEDWTATLAVAYFGALQALPGARRGVDVPTTAWLVTLLFWKVAGRGGTGAPPGEAEAEAIATAMGELIYHAFFEGS